MGGGRYLTANSYPKILLVCNQRIYDTYVAPEEVQRLEKFASLEWLPYEDDNNLDKEKNKFQYVVSPPPLGFKNRDDF